jgi:hypothetical protein
LVWPGLPGGDGSLGSTPSYHFLILRKIRKIRISLKQFLLVINLLPLLKMVVEPAITDS